MPPFERLCPHCVGRLRRELAAVTLAELPLARRGAAWSAAADGAIDVFLRPAGAAGSPGPPSSAGWFDATRGYNALHWALQSDAPVLTAPRGGGGIDFAGGGFTFGSTLRFELVSTLLELGADADAGTLLGRARPLALAAARGEPRLLAALVAHGASVGRRTDARGGTALHAARGAAAAGWLVGAGADIHAADARGKTPLRTAEERGDAPAAELLDRLLARAARDAARRAAADAEARRRKVAELEARRDAILGVRRAASAADAAERAGEEYKRWRAGEPAADEPARARVDLHYERALATHSHARGGEGAARDARAGAGGETLRKPPAARGASASPPRAAPERATATAAAAAAAGASPPAGRGAAAARAARTARSPLPSSLSIADLQAERVRGEAAMAINRALLEERRGCIERKMGGEYIRAVP